MNECIASNDDVNMGGTSVSSSKASAAFSGRYDLLSSMSVFGDWDSILFNIVLSYSDIYFSKSLCQALHPHYISFMMKWDEDIIVCADGSTILFWRISDGELINSILQEEKIYISQLLCINQHALASLGIDGSISVWSIKNDIHNIHLINRIPSSKGRTQLVAGGTEDEFFSLSRDTECIEIWNLNMIMSASSTGKEVQLLPNKTIRPPLCGNQVFFEKLFHSLYAISLGRSISIYRYNPLRQEMTQIRTFAIPAYITAPIFYLNKQGYVHHRDFLTSNAHHEAFMNIHINSVHLQQRNLREIEKFLCFIIDDCIFVWEYLDFKRKALYKLKGHELPVHNVSLLDNQFMISVDQYNIRIWDWKKQECIWHHTTDYALMALVGLSTNVFAVGDMNGALRLYRWR